MKFNLYFVPQGAKVLKENNLFIIHYNEGTWQNPKHTKIELPSKNTVVLDTGNALEPGIIDHHQPNCGFENQCVASLVVEHGEKYLKHLLTQNEVNIVTHFIPDLDALGSVYFTMKFLNQEPFSFLDTQLAEYVNMVDMGKLILDPEKPVGIASLWLNYTNIKDYSIAFTQDFNKELVHKGLKFLDAVINVIRKDENPWTNEGFDQIEFLKDPIQNILKDTENYELDVENSITGIVELYNRDTRGMDEVEVIISKDAKSFLWKYLVRGDRKNTLFGEGFKLTALHMPGKKGVIISVDPNLPYSLKGLGVYLDSLELEHLLKTSSMNEVINGTEGSPRAGFHRNNPWYDGRGAHNFTIIDVPKGGTNLSETQINDAIFAYSLWDKYAELCNLETSKTHVFDTNSLNSFEQIEWNKRPFLGMNNENRELVLPYNQKLSLFQIESFLKADKLIPYNEVNGSEIEELCNNPINDVFILVHKIRDSLKKLHVTSYSNYEYITKSRYWSEMLAKFISDGFSFFDNRAYEVKKNDFIRAIEPYLNNTFAHTLLKECFSIPPASFAALFAKVESSIKKSDLIYEILSFQTSFPNAFLKENLQKYILNNEHVSTECKVLLEKMFFVPWSESIYEEIPIYAYNNLKNYVDDLLHLLASKSKNSDFISRINTFKKTDFKQIVETELVDCDFERIQDLRMFFEEGKGLLFHELFDENFKKLKLQKYEIIKRLNPKENGNLLNSLINLDFEFLKNAPFNAVRSRIEPIEKFGGELSKSLIPVNFLNELKLFEELASFDLLLGRIEQFVSMKELGNQDKYLQELNQLLFSFLRVITLYTNFNNTEELQDEIGISINKLAALRMFPSQLDRFETNQLREKLAVFVPVILDEISLPVDDLDVQIQNSLSQYELIMGQGGIMEELEKLPLYYRQRFTDIFAGFKSYYKERLNFFRSDLKLLIDESETGNEKKLTNRYIETCNNLINESVAFDWQELKDQVDSLEDNKDNQEIKATFYWKYFYWLSLNSSEDKDSLYHLNSEIRFAEGKSDENTFKIVENLPVPPIKEEISLYHLMVDFQLVNIIKHKPINLIHDSYDFLIEHFISKYHVDNVRETLARFSTKFPWYYRYLSDKKYLRMLFIILAILMLGAGAFDTNEYNGKLAPLSNWLETKLGNGLYLIISEVLAYSWGILISLSFILPVLFLLNYLYHRYILNEKPDESDKEEKLNFFQLIESIEGKRSHLLYIPFVIPLLIVVLQMSSPDTISLINKIEGFRFFSTLFLVVGLTILSVFNYVKERNSRMSSSWLIQRTEHMLWLHLIQSFVISIFVIDLILRFQVSIDDFNDDSGGLFFLGMSKYIQIKRGFIDVVIMPTFTMMITILTLFFSFFIEKIFGNQGE
jgi:hypothetical protein